MFARLTMGAFEYVSLNGPEVEQLSIYYAAYASKPFPIPGEVICFASDDAQIHIRLGATQGKVALHVVVDGEESLDEAPQITASGLDILFP